MDITIKIDDESRFKDIIQDELEAFSKEELHDILAEALKNKLENSNIIEDLLVNKSYNDNTPTRLAHEIFRSLDYSAFQDIVNNKIKSLSKSIEQILKEALLDTMINSLANTDIFRNMVQEEIYKHERNNSY